MSEWLHEPLAHPPLPVAHERSPELGEAIGRLLESAKDLLPLVDGEREHLRLNIPGTLEPLRGVDRTGLPKQTSQPTLAHMIVTAPSSNSRRTNDFRGGNL